nr:hemagglutinin repeat-containing protein [Rodentibacter haemolyticus]
MEINLTTQASSSGKQGTVLIADNDVNLTAQQQTHKERSRNKSSGFNAGVAIAVGNGVSFGITAGGNYGRGYGNGDDETYRNSHIGDSSSQTLIQAGNNATLKGAQVQGKGVTLNAENLHIESLQDKMKYQGKQMNVSGQVTAGYGFSASGSYSQSNINSDYASVVEQSGIYAGDEGYQINVGNHTSLKGGLIISSQQAENEGKNRFSTGTLTAQNIENHSNYKGTAFGVSGSTSMGGGEAAKEVGGAKLMTFGNNTQEQRIDTRAGDVTTKTEGQLSLSKSIGFGYDTGSQSSVTKSGINTANIEIRNANAQLSKSGKTVAETLSAIRTDVTTERAVKNSGVLVNNFDKDRVQKELNTQLAVTQAFDKNRIEAKQELYDIADKKRAEAVSIRRGTYIDGKSGYNTDKSLELDNFADKVEKVAFYLDVALGSLYSFGSPTATAYMATAVSTDPIVRAALSPEQIWMTTCKQDSLYCADNNLDGTKRPTENGKAQIGDKRQIFDISELKPSEGNYTITVSNNGILNPLDDALKNAIKQNSWETNKDGVAVIYNRPTGNPISELLYAAYDKTNDLLGGRLPLTTAEKANVKLYQYAKQNGYQLDLSNHSRGGLTASVALQNANRNGLKNIPIRESRFFGTATNVQDYTNQLASNGTYIYKTSDGSIKTSDSYGITKSAVHYSDFVGRSPLITLRSKFIVGGNQPTGGVDDAWFMYSHSSYFAEVPDPYLKNEQGQYIDKKGSVVDENNRVANDYFDEFKEKWKPKNKWDNPSLPIIIYSQGVKKNEK